MKKFILVLIVAIVLAFSVSTPSQAVDPVPVEGSEEVITSDSYTSDTAEPAPVVDEAEQAQAGQNYTCTKRSITSKRARDWQWWGYRGQIWTNTMYYTKCESPFNYYYKIRSFRYMLDLDTSGKLDCSGGEITQYVINGWPIGSANPAMHEWDCVGGKSNYVKTQDIANVRLDDGAADKCFGFNWRIRIFAHNDPEGNGPTKCLA